MSKASLHYPNNHTFWHVRETSQTGQGTKSLRSSPLRGDVNRESCDRSTGPR